MLTFDEKRLLLYREKYIQNRIKTNIEKLEAYIEHGTEFIPLCVNIFGCGDCKFYSIGCDLYPRPKMNEAELVLWAIETKTKLECCLKS